ncbi:hypothetical protein PR202_ga21793 [Eleusine coracana subsp. coracana]|uniref:Uncharacterized protein n=1 Tax=Eleusine coracana subsp. coracana TaxID=191504 RepID=A0AAV5D1I5_ELECO|nr:hypothetical protein PR202_ga21793 [Eleusine coracana subsp. coracana]
MAYLEQRNTCVFYGASPRLQTVVRVILEDATTWSLAGPARLTDLLERLPSASVVTYTSGVM